MRLEVSLFVWLTLAVIGMGSAGFWGFLGVAFLYVLYYGLLRPRVTVHITAQELEAAAERESTSKAARNAILLGTAATALKALSGKSPKRLAASHSAPSANAAPPPDGSLSWTCACGTRNANRRTRCRACDGPNPA